MKLDKLLDLSRWALVCSLHYWQVHKSETRFHSTYLVKSNNLHQSFSVLTCFICDWTHFIVTLTTLTTSSRENRWWDPRTQSNFQIFSPDTVLIYSTFVVNVNDIARIFNFINCFCPKYYTILTTIILKLDLFYFKIRKSLRACVNDGTAAPSLSIFFVTKS